MMRSGLRHLSVCALVAFPALSFLACGETSARRAERAAARFHERMRASQFAEIYREASTDLRERETEEVFVNKLREVRARLGDIVGVEKSYPFDMEDAERGWFLNSFVVKGTAEEGQELFAWDVSGAEFKLDRYRIRFKQGTELINLTP